MTWYGHTSISLSDGERPRGVEFIHPNLRLVKGAYKEPTGHRLSRKREGGCELQENH